MITVGRADKDLVPVGLYFYLIVIVEINYYQFSFANFQNFENFVIACQSDSFCPTIKLFTILKFSWHAGFKYAPVNDLSISQKTNDTI